MRISTIEIRRFAGIKHLQLSVNRNLQVIAGPNNSCKSTVLKALNTFFNLDLLSDKEISDTKPENDYFNAEKRTSTHIKLRFSDLTKEEVTLLKTAIIKRKNEFWVELKIARDNRRTYKTSNQSLNENQTAKFIEDLLSQWECHYVPAVRGGTSELSKIETQHVLNTARNVLIKKSKRTHNKLTSEIKTSVLKAHDIIEQLFIDSFDKIKDLLPEQNEISIRFPDFEDTLSTILDSAYISTRAKTKLTTENEGNGFQSMLSLGLLHLITEKKSAENLLLLIEEPEAFLHPQHQRAISKQIDLLSHHAQVIITTHSSVIIDTIPLSKIRRLKREIDGIDQEWQTKIPPESEYLSRYCDSKNSELIFAEKIVLVEGLTDKLITEEILDSITEKSHHSSNISVIACDGTSIEHIAKLSDLLKIESLLILDKDSYSGQDKKMLRRICKSRKMDLNGHETNTLEQLKNTKITSISQTFEIRNQANTILSKRNIFTLSGDVEHGVLSSFTKGRLNRMFSERQPIHLNHDNIRELASLKGYAFTSRLNDFFGSKGPETKRSNNDKKPRPHTMRDLMVKAGINNSIENSDLTALKEILNDFVLG